MWLSTRKGPEQEEFAPAERGRVSVGGKMPTVLSGGVQVPVTVFAPGGLCWLPKRGQEILVIKAGEGGEEGCCLGGEMEVPEGLAPGELCLRTEKAALWIKNDGRILLEGTVYVNGEELK